MIQHRWTNDSAAYETDSSTAQISCHARSRMSGRRISEGDLDAVITYGRRIHGRGAQIYVVGRKEIEACRKEGLDVRSLEGIHVVCSREGVVITTYRNRGLDGVRGLR